MLEILLAITFKLHAITFMIIFYYLYPYYADQGSVNQPFIVNKKRGILRGRECPSQLIQTFIQTFNTSSRHTLPHFTKYL